ncbi:MAG TPA: flippase [Candidatus Acidoferrales bacterium]|nr:flippase [Candidatus Acidoferrales bacterium]
MAQVADSLTTQRDLAQVRALAGPSLDEQPARLRHNVAALGVVQLSNYAIPLLTLPFLTRVLGPEAYGKVVFSQVLMAYFVLLTDYGFSWSATRKISAHRNDRAYVNQIFLGTWLAQWLLAALAAMLCAVVIALSDHLRPDAPLYAAAFTAVIGNVLFPVWFLQGLERLQEVAALQLISRVLALIPLFLLVRQPSDASLVAAIQGGGVMLGGVLALIWIHRQELVHWQWPHWAMARQELGEGLTLFSSRLSISFYTTLVPLVLGWVAGPVAVAHFALADKLRSAAQSLLSPISQALFPRMSHLFATDRAAALRLVKRSALAIFLLAGSASAGLWLLADRLILLLAGPEFMPAAAVLRWLAFVPLIIGFSNLFGLQIMIPNGMNRAFNLILTAAGLACVAVLWPLVHSMQARGAAASMLFVEAFVTGSMMLWLLRRGHIGSSCTHPPQNVKA